MCKDCGCGQVEEATIHGGHRHHHDDHDHDHHHDHDHPLHLYHVADDASKARLLAQNDHIAAHNREHFERRGVLCVNLISAPGSGKTALLERMIADWRNAPPAKVIQGDLKTENDANRIRRAGLEAIQVNTGQGCHLDAAMIHRALHRLDLPENGLLLIENVGNMVCPADFDLGEHHKIALIACTEGHDKPTKYPGLIKAADVLLISKTDLLPYTDFDVATCKRLALEQNPTLKIICVSAKTGRGVTEFCHWLEQHHQIACMA